MIIPDIKVVAGKDWAADLLGQIRYWSLFGQVKISLPWRLSEEEMGWLNRIVKQAGGWADLIIDGQLADQEALELLNVGGSRIWTTPEQRESFGSIPDDRLLLAGAGNTVVAASPSASELVELEDQKVDAVVPANWLGENSEVVADYYDGILKSDREDGLWSTIICDPLGIALGLAYSNRESLLHALKTREGAYWSRSRGGLWVKGLTSGATQGLLGIRFDCDRDCLRFTVTQDPPGFCHRQTHTCFGEERTIATVIQRLKERIDAPDEKSFTRKLANDPVMLEKKLLEEAQELSEASQQDDRYEVAWEAADVMYFSLVAMLNNGVGLEEVYAELARRMNRIVRRKNKLEPESTNEKAD